MTAAQYCIDIDMDMDMDIDDSSTDCIVLYCIDTVVR